MYLCLYSCMYVRLICCLAWLLTYSVVQVIPLILLFSLFFSFRLGFVCWKWLSLAALVNPPPITRTGWRPLDTLLFRYAYMAVRAVPDV